MNTNEKQPRDLVLISKARRALAEARDIPELVDIRDRGQAAIKWAKSRRDIGLAAQNDAAEIVLRAERRLGGELAGMEKQHGARPPDTGSHDVTPLTLADLGITKMRSSRWQAEARVPKSSFETWMGETREAEKKLTSGALVKLGRQEMTTTVTPNNKIRQASEGIVEDLNQLAGQEFGCIYADPPWKYNNQGTRAATSNHYQTMTVDEIAAEPVSDLAADNCHLHLWTTNAFLFDAKQVMEAWGFGYKSVLIWVKPQMGIGNYWRVSHEFLLFGTRGKAPFRDRGQKSWIEVSRTKHSKKPDEVRKKIEKVSPGPYLELYGRKPIRDWVVYGDQIEGTLFPK